MFGNTHEVLAKHGGSVVLAQIVVWPLVKRDTKRNTADLVRQLYDLDILFLQNCTERSCAKL